MVGKSENFFGNRNDPNRDERENKTRVFTHARAFPSRVCVYNVHIIYIFFMRVG